MAQDRLRLDLLLVNRGLYKTRSRSRDAISRGCVQVAGTIVSKPGALYDEGARIEVDDPAIAFVSRASLKLLHALKISNYSPRGKICLDVGASTGGFSQVLLDRGARMVFALDVGHGQLDPLLGNDDRVIELSGLNARELKSTHLNNLQPEFLVSDVSFISLKLALPAALDIAADGAKGLFLIKPQFEVGRENLGKGGIVRNLTTARAAADNVCEWLSEVAGWHIDELMPSPIEGSDGNHEFIVAAGKPGVALDE